MSTRSIVPLLVLLLRLVTRAGGTARSLAASARRLLRRATRRDRDGAASSPARAAFERGQATAEYALVLLGVAAIALLLAAWAARSGKISELFDSVVDQLIAKAR